MESLLYSVHLRYFIIWKGASFLGGTNIFKEWPIGRDGRRSEKWSLSCPRRHVLGEKYSSLKPWLWYLCWGNNQTPLILSSFVYHLCFSTDLTSGRKHIFHKIIEAQQQFYFSSLVNKMALHSDFIYQYNSDGWIHSQLNAKAPNGH